MPDGLVLVHQRMFVAMMAIMKKILNPWRGPYHMRHRLSTVVYRVTLDDKSTGTLVHLARMKPYHSRSTTVEPHFEELVPMILGTKLPLPDMDRTSTSVGIGQRLVGHVRNKRGKGRPSTLNVKFRIRYSGAGPSSDGWYHRRQILHCQECIHTYLAANQDR